MKRSMFVLVFLFLSIKLIPAPNDSGMITWLQPDEITTFTAQLIRDEFNIKFTTRDGYEIREGVDGWFYYATLDGNGKIVPGNLKVGLDAPPPTSLNLAPSPSAQSEIDQRELDFQQQLFEADIWYKQKREEASGGAVTLKIGVILVDFADHVHYTDLVNYPNGYPKHFFNDVLFSQNTWIDVNPNDPIKTHPENKNVYGSLRDYLNQQSCGKLDIKGKKIDGVDVYTDEILNPSDPSGFPQWLYLNETRAYWDGIDMAGITKISYEEWAVKIKNQLNVDLIIDNKNVYDRLILIFAGGAGNYGLWPQTSSNQVTQISERFTRSLNVASLFTHVGVYCHEFGHLLGAPDEGLGNVVQGYWDIMHFGTWNGPEQKGECPAGFDPYYRTKWGWVNLNYFDDISSKQTKTILYDYNNPKYYKLDNPIDPSEYFIIENRGRNGFDKYTPNDFNYSPPNGVDANGNLGGLLIWTIAENSRAIIAGKIYSDIVGLKSAMTGVVLDKITAENNFGASDPFPYTDGQSLTQNTFPNNSVRNVQDSKVNLENIRWESDGSILVDISRTSQNDVELVSGVQEWTTNRTIDKDIFLMGGATLTIKEGVVLNINQNKKIKIYDNATLKAEAISNSIILTNNPNNPSDKWAGIEIFGENSHLITSNLVIQNATSAFYFSGIKNIFLNSITFNSNSSFCSNINSLSQLEIVKCKFNATPFYLSAYAQNNSVSVKFSKNVFVNSFIYLMGDGISFSFINNDFKMINNSSPIVLTLNYCTDYLIKDNIFLNTTIAIPQSSNPSLITYNCIYPYPANYAIFSGQGNFSADPLFADPGNLESQTLQQNSPCIDMGDPTMDYSNEPAENGGRINIGSLGNTALATVVDQSTPRDLSAISMLGNLSLSSSSNWSVNGTCDIDGSKTLETPNLTVNIGGTLNIQPGAKLNFLNGSSLIVQGNLSANGVTFDRAPGESNYWGSIIFDGPDAWTSVLDNVTVNNAANIQILNRADVTVQNSIIQNCAQGIYVYNANPQLLSNQINEPLYHGIYVDASENSLIVGNSISKSNKQNQGIILYGSCGWIAVNSVSGFDHGLYVGGSSAYFTDWEYRSYFSNNCFSGNRYGIVAGWGGYVEGDPGGEVEGNNVICYNDEYDIYVYQHSLAYAMYNYWGGGDPMQYVDGTSGLYVLPVLPNAPWGSATKLITSVDALTPEVQLTKTNGESASETNDISNTKGLILKAQAAKLNNDLSTTKDDDEFLKGIKLKREGKIDEAIEQLKKVVKDKKYGLYAITELAGIKARYGKENIQTYFEDLLKDPNEGNKSRIKRHLAGFYLNKNEDDRAVTLFDELKDDKGSKRDNFEGLYGKFNFMLHKKKDLVSAKNLLAEMKNKFADDEEAMIHIATAEMLMSGKNKLALGKKQNETTASNETEMPKEYALFNNYPNPFNPVTTITYQLPKSGSVTLKIFDVLGREVKTLVNEQKEMGRYTVTFNASSFASGMYVYQLRANDFISTKKMLLLK